MGVSINDDKIVSIDTRSYIKEILEALSEKIKTGSTSPVNRNVFNIKERVSELSDQKAGLFHSLVARLL